MKLIFAQGNPGAQFARTRHNVGFMALDALAAAEQVSWKKEAKHKAEIAIVHIAGEKTLLVKPTTFYNETGLSARSLVDFYKLRPAEDVLVIHDELALPFGSVRVRQKGSDAGNNGIKSLSAHLGEQYWRIRVGIWNELRDRMNDADFVLSAFTQSEQEKLVPVIVDVIVPSIEKFVRGTLEGTSHTA